MSAEKADRKTISLSMQDTKGTLVSVRLVITDDLICVYQKHQDAFGNDYYLTMDNIERPGREFIFNLISALAAFAPSSH